MLNKRIFPLIVTVAISIASQASAANPGGDVGERTWLGAVTLCTGESLITRQDGTWSAVRGAGFQVNDRLETRPGATLSLTVFQGPTLTIAQNSLIKIYPTKNGLGLAVTRGEIRVVHSGDEALELSTPESSIDLGRSIVRLQRSGSASTVEIENGSARARRTGQRFQELNVGETFIFENDLLKSASHSAIWQINPGHIRLASAQQSGPTLSVPTIPNTQGNSPSPPGPAPQNPALNQAPPTTANPSNNLAQQEEDERRRRNQGQNPNRGGGNAQSSSQQAVTGPSFSGSSSISLGSFSGATGTFSAGGLFADANQQSFEGQVLNGGPRFAENSPFPGAIHLVTGETRYALDNVQLNSAEQAAIAGPGYYSIGLGAAPTAQVVTDAITASNDPPKTQNIPKFDAHIVKLEQYGPPDANLDSNAALNNTLGITGLVGATPSGPAVFGTAPLVDERANFNQTATFALGEFRVTTDVNGGIAFAVRRSDQDRLIVKDANGNDALDQVTPNPDVTFEDVVDARFLPQSPTVKSPIANVNALNPRGTTYTELNSLRKAAMTTIMAENLQGYSMRTGQTRFVVDGNKIIDISGYRPPTP